MSNPELTSEERQQFENLLEFIKQTRGFDFAAYKRPTLVRRITKRMQTVNIASFDEYRDHLEVQPDEYEQLFDTILINVTSFFRDPPAWEYLAAEVLPRLLDAKPSPASLRVWVTGCASGEEAYTVAMLLAEAIGLDEFRERAKIYATDVDGDALGSARLGRYSADDVQAIPADLRARYLDQFDGGFAFRGDLRRGVIFGRHDLLSDPPISRIDLLLARNTLMYFNADTQGRVLANFHFALNDGGFLFLGKSEMLLTRSNLFTPFDLKRRVFQPTPKASFRERLLDMAHTPQGEPSAHDELTTRARDAAFDAGPAASFVISPQGELVAANRPARALFRLAARDLGRQFHELDVSFRPVELRSPIEDAARSGHAVAIPDVEVTNAAGERRYLDFHIVPLTGSEGRHIGTAVTAADVTRYRTLQETVERSRGDLETAYEELQATTEELETTNEELQSTNEELETMNEELQSTNEELETMNDELRMRTDDLNAVNGFLDAILTSLHQGVIVLDKELRIRAWNAAATDLWGLREEEVDGEHFLNLDIGLPVNNLSRSLRTALAGDVSEHVVQATNRRGRPVDVRVRTAPMAALGKEAGVLVLMEEDGQGE